MKTPPPVLTLSPIFGDLIAASCGAFTLVLMGYDSRTAIRAAGSWFERRATLHLENELRSHVGR